MTELVGFEFVVPFKGEGRFSTRGCWVERMASLRLSFSRGIISSVGLSSGFQGSSLEVLLECTSELAVDLIPDKAQVATSGVGVWLSNQARLVATRLMATRLMATRLLATRLLGLRSKVTCCLLSACTLAGMLTV
jgi:hypothetical protein